MRGNSLVLLPVPAPAAVSAPDDAGHIVTLSAPARRIVSLAPHATELLYAVGAGASLVGVIEYSDYPPEARRIASVGSAAAFDIERIIALKPDLVVTWSSGNPAAKIVKLRSLGITVFESEPRDFENIASLLERLARLAGTDPIGQAAAKAFRTRLKTIAATYRHRPPVRVFYQIWNTPLMTLNDTHMVSAALRLCGGKNVFGKLPQLAPSSAPKPSCKRIRKSSFPAAATETIRLPAGAAFPNSRQPREEIYLRSNRI